MPIRKMMTYINPVLFSLNILAEVISGSFQISPVINVFDIILAVQKINLTDCKIFLC